jgi:HEAT repeat protein
MLSDIYKKSTFISVRKAALYAIEDMAEEEAVGPLTEMLKAEKDPEMRRMIVRVLGETGSDDAVPVLEKSALEDLDKKVRLEAVDALEEIDTPRAREALMRIIKKLDQRAAKTWKKLF